MYMKKIAIRSEYKINNLQNILDNVHLIVVHYIVTIS